MAVNNMVNRRKSLPDKLRTTFHSSELDLHGTVDSFGLEAISCYIDA
jgi:hypothetical protein